MNFRIFDLQYDAEFRKKFQAGCEKIFDEGFLTQHTFVQRFESEFATGLGLDPAVSVMNGSAALQLGLMAVGVSGKKVLLPVNTFIASASSVLLAQGVPVLVDCDESGQFHLESLIKKIEKEKPQFIMLVHVGGLFHPQFKQLLEICEHSKIEIVEDCAHAHGSLWNNRPAGTFGEWGAYSFHLTKTMTTGEGGALVSRKQEVLEKVRRLREFGRTQENKHLFEEVSSNFKMTEFQGLLGCLELERSIQRIEARRRIHQRYTERLDGKSGFQVLQPPQGSTSGFYKTIVLSDRPRSFFKSLLSEKGIPLTNSVYEWPLHRQPVMKEHFKDQNFPCADHFSEFHFCPPCFPELTESQIDQICDVLLMGSR